MRIGMLSTFPPRRCGIATFTADLTDSLRRVAGVDVVDVFAMGGEQDAGPDVVARIDPDRRASYARAGRLADRLGHDVVMIQHEYGIFGGPDGAHVLDFTSALTMPYVVTLHTVLRAPTPSQAAVLGELCRGAAAVQVFTPTARKLLIATGGVDPDHVHVVPHGAPEVICQVAQRSRVPSVTVAGSDGAATLSTVGRFVLSSFGLLSPGKGLEVVLDAVAKLVPAHPEILLVIAGQTHPEVARHHGEEYRRALGRRVAEAGLEDHVVFDDRFLPIDDIADLLAATDLFVTAYPAPDQIVSGALTFAVAAGRPVISTPYLYACDLLAGGAGRLVPFGDAAALAEGIAELVERPAELTGLAAVAREVGAHRSWPAVARATAAILASPLDADTSAPSAGAHPAPPLLLDQLRVLTDDVGIVQHARGTVPNLATGYCVDDVARLLQVSHRLAGHGGDSEWRTTASRALAFLWHAAEHHRPGMHNFMGYDRRWLDEPHLGDHVARAVWALGEHLCDAPAADPAHALLERLCADLAEGPTSPRMAAYSLLGLCRLADPSVHQRYLVDELTRQLVDAHARHHRPDWDWFEPELTYDNARLSQALIVAAGQRHDRALLELGLRTLRWYGDVCHVRTVLRLPGNRGCAGPIDDLSGDEQPLDAAALVEAELDALAATGEREHAFRALNAFAWFTGQNRAGDPLYDPLTGGCRDGLGVDGASLNEGAESTLAYYTARLALDAAELGGDSRRVAA